jgi:hypothetical protein
VQIGIQQQRVTAGYLHQVRRHIGRDRGCANAAAYAGDRDDASGADLQARGVPADDQWPEMPRDHFPVQRAVQVFQHAERARDLAVEGHIVRVTDYQHPHAGLDELCQVVQHQQRIRFVRDVQDQHTGRGFTLQCLAPGGEIGATDGVHRPQQVSERLPQHVFGRAVPHIDSEARGVGAAGFLFRGGRTPPRGWRPWPAGSPRSRAKESRCRRVGTDR